MFNSVSLSYDKAIELNQNNLKVLREKINVIKKYVKEHPGDIHAVKKLEGLFISLRSIEDSLEQMIETHNLIKRSYEEHEYEKRSKIHKD